jgi:integrase
VVVGKKKKKANRGRSSASRRVRQDGTSEPLLVDFQKSWDTGCEAIGMPGRIPHDLRRSGIKHYIDAGNDPHVVMQWSRHRE